jgi:iron(III) transport system substrate-binding protein
MRFLPAIAHRILAALAAMLSVAAVGTANASQADWQKRWESTVALARKEGTVVVAASSVGSETRPELTAAFTKRFGFRLEMIVMGGAEIAARVEREAVAGRLTLDLIVSGADELLSLLPAGRLEALRDRLILPEVLDPAKWRGNKLKFNDREGRYLLQTSEYLPADLVINTSRIKAESITSWKELLKPDFKEKIASFDPRRAGPGMSTAAYLLERFGQDFVRKLYLDQQVVYTSDPRQLAEWVARGVYPIGLAVGSRQVEPLRTLGQPIRRVFPQDGPGYLSGGPSVIKLLKNAPHPHAAIVFANWFSSREPQEIYQRTVATVSRRVDVDLTGVPDYVIPKQGIEYMDTYTDAYIRESRPKLQKILGDLLGR